MKNALNIAASGETLLSTVDDGTNRLYINGTIVPSTDWTGTGTYTATVQGHQITIAKVEDDSGNVALRKTADYTYELYKIKTGTTIEGDLEVTGNLVVTGDISEGGQKLSEKYGAGGEMVTLWTGNPEGYYGAQTLPLSQDTADFDYFLIQVRAAAWSDSYHTNTVLNDGRKHSCMAPQVANGATLFFRDFTISGSSCVISTGWYVTSGGSGNNTGHCVPCKIIGVKL